MNKGPAEAIAGLAITGLIFWMHSKHIWPFNSILNECIVLIVCVVVFLIASAKGG
jgi:hypothetical protein